ncbi:MAG: hypothetical protein ABJA78_03575 [Ferruginibacter sp.]
MFIKKFPAVFFLLLTGLCGSLKAQVKPEKKLIEFGWDFPTINFLNEHITEMENSPFDGVVFSFDRDVFHAFDTIALEDKDFQYEASRRIRWKKFTDNFIFVRGISASGGHWLEDKNWEIIISNITKLSAAVVATNAKGIGLDFEYYYPDPDKNPWIYKASLYKGLSYQQVGAFVRKRGNQFMTALQKDSRNIKILCFWLLGLVIDQHKVRSLPETGMALVPFFVEGLLEAQNKTSEIIDGNETAYWYNKPEDFIRAREKLQTEGAALLAADVREKYKKVSNAECIYLDGLYAKTPGTDRGLDKATKERWLHDNLYHAYKTTDKYIWFYNENVNWWKHQVDSGVEAIINRVQNNLTDEKMALTPKSAGQSRTFNIKEKMPAQEKGFTYEYNSVSKNLQVKLLQPDLKKLQLFQNSRLIYSLNNPGQNLTISLAKKFNGQGTLILLTEDSNGKTAVAYIN